MAKLLPRAAPAVCRRVLLVGDLDNLGDALLAEVEADQLAHRGPPGSLVVSPYATPPDEMTAHLARHGASVLPMRARPLAFLHACFAAELFIGGGHVIREPVSVGWLLLTLLGCVVARLGGGQAAVVGAGVTPVMHCGKRWLWRQILQRCQTLRVRDKASAQVLRHLWPRLAGRVSVTNDMAFMGGFDAAPVRAGPAAVCVVSPAVDRHEGRRIDQDRLLQLIAGLHRRGLIGEVRLLAHDIRPAFDTSLCEALARRIQSELGLRATLVSGPLGTRLIDAYRHADLVVTGRLHGLIVASMLRRPVVCFGDTRGKLWPFARRIGSPTAGSSNESPEVEAERVAAFLRGFDHHASQPLLLRLRDEARMNIA